METAKSLLQEQNSTTETSTSNKKSSELLKIIPYDEYLNIVEDNTDTQPKYFATLGRYRLTEDHYNYQELEQLLDKRDYSIIFGIIGACLEAKKQIDTTTSQI